MYLSHIHEYVKCTWNVHYIWISKHENTYDFFFQVRNFLLPLSLKVLRHKERNTHSFYSGFFICPSISMRHLPKASASKRKSTVFSRGRSQPHSQIFSKSPNPPRASDAWRHSHLLAPFPIWAGLTSLNDTSAVRAWTPTLMLHLSKPCAEPKGSQPN